MSVPHFIWNSPRIGNLQVSKVFLLATTKWDDRASIWSHNLSIHFFFAVCYGKGTISRSVPSKNAAYQLVMVDNVSQNRTASCFVWLFFS